MGLGLALVGALRCGLVGSHQTTASVTPTQPQIACGEVYLLLLVDGECREVATSQEQARGQAT